MKCAFCGLVFNKDDGKVCCRGCPMAGVCHMVRCPGCGYEAPVAPEMRRIRSLVRSMFRRETTEGG